MNMHGADSVMVWSGDNWQNLWEFQLSSGDALWSERRVRAAVHLPDINCLAVSCPRERKIIFINGNLEDRPFDVLTAFKPTVICLGQPGYVFIMDGFNNAVHRMDYSSWPPQLLAPLTSVTERNVFDMCHIEYGNKVLIILSCGEEGLSAYNIIDNTLEWKRNGQLIGMNSNINLKGITKDKCGHLFVCDSSNGCIQMFSFNGTYLGVVLKEGEQGLGKPMWIRIKENPLSFVVAHKEGEYWQVSVVRITNPWDPEPYFQNIFKSLSKLFVKIWPFGRNIQN